MLVLTRKQEQSIIIGDSTEIMVLGVSSSGKVRLGVTAPREIDVVRKEVLADRAGTQAREERA